MTRSILAPERLTPDAQHDAYMMTKGQYVAHLEILRALKSKPAHSAYLEGYFVTALTYDGERAWIALCNSGVLSDTVRPGQYRITSYGKVYARQRGIEL